jgi:hypothetical protein
MFVFRKITKDKENLRMPTEQIAFEQEASRISRRSHDVQVISPMTGGDFAFQEAEKPGVSW